MTYYLTKPERVLKKAMEEAGIDAIPQYPIPLKLNLDFKIRGLLIDIEVDGVYWHRGKKRLDYDKRRDYVMNQKGYKILRFTDTQVLNDIDNVIKKIKEVINNEKCKNKINRESSLLTEQVNSRTINEGN